MDRRLPPEVVETAQLLGARLRNDSFFTVQDVYKAFNRGDMDYRRIPGELSFEVQMRIGKKSSRMRVPLLPENTAIDKDGKVHAVAW